MSGMQWTCSCGNVNTAALCAKCGGMRQTLNEPDPGERRMWIAIGLMIVLGIPVIALLYRWGASSDTAPSTVIQQPATPPQPAPQPIPTPASEPPPPSPEQLRTSRLAELQKQKEDIESQLVLHSMHARTIAKEVQEIVVDPLPEPGAREWAKQQMAESTAEGDKLPNS